jgi:hypothetical protein
MDAVIFFLIAIALLVVLDMAVLAFGVDSRDSVGDDHRRPIAL